MSEIDTSLPRLIEGLRNYARFLTRTDKDRADDLMQETALRAWSKRHLFQEGTNAKLWLASIMHNTQINYVRQNARRATVSYEPSQHILPTKAPQHSHMEFLDTARMFERLPKEQRQVIAMIAEGLRYEDAAKLLTIPTGTVRSRLSRGRDELQALAERRDNRINHKPHKRLQHELV